MKPKIYVPFLFVLILWGCNGLITIDDSIEIKKAIPNPAKVEDTLNILVKNINIPLNVESIDQVKILLEENNRTYIFQATGYYDQLNRQEYGNFSHSNLMDSLARNFQPIIQCIVDSSYPSQSKIGVQLNEKILTSNIILNVAK